MRPTLRAPGAGGSTTGQQLERRGRVPPSAPSMPATGAHIRWTTGVPEHVSRSGQQSLVPQLFSQLLPLQHRPLVQRTALVDDEQDCRG